MRVGTMVSLGASAVLGIGALVVAKVWLPSQTSHSQATAAAEASQQGVPVVVASQPIAYGSKLDAGHLTVVRLPPGAVPEGSFTTVQQVIDQPGGAPVALQQIAPREPVLRTELSGPGARPNLAATIGEGMRAYTIGVSDVLGGGGHILPGDRVDVVLTRQLDGPSDGGNSRLYVTSVVTQNIRVMGMDLNADPATTRAAVAHTATLEVSLEDTVRLALASQAGTLSLALRRTGEAEIVSLRPIRLDNPGGGRGRSSAGDPPSPPPPPSAAPRMARPSYEAPRRTMTVTQGGTRSTVEVPADRSGS